MICMQSQIHCGCFFVNKNHRDGKCRPDKVFYCLRLIQLVSELIVNCSARTDLMNLEYSPDKTED